MRSRSLFAVSAAAAALGSGVLAGSAAQASTSSAVQASGTEFHIALSRGTVRAGRLRVEFDNFGQDDHDLAVTRKSGGTTRKLPVVHPGNRSVLTIATKPGTYVFWCTISDHKAKGMRAVLRVTR